MATWKYSEDKKIRHRLTYDDVLIRPGYSTAESRLDCQPMWSVFDKEYSPIIVANMDTISTLNMAEAVAAEGVMVPFHRFQSVRDQLLMLQEFHAWKCEKKFDRRVMCAAAVGLPEPEERFERIKEYCDVLFLDVAYAYNTQAIQEAERIRKSFDGILVVGNVATAEAVQHLEGIADLVKCGVGNGSVCTTRLVTGCGLPQVGALIECVEAGKEVGISVIADGGVKTAGDIVKALCLGAKYVMVGSMFAGTEESAGDGYDKRIYRGLASKDAQVDRFGSLPTWVAPEGISAVVSYKGPAERVVQVLHASIRQGMAMVGVTKLEDLARNSVLQVISPATKHENVPHILDRY